MRLNKKYYDNSIEIAYDFDSLTNLVLASLTSGEYIFTPGGHADFVKDREQEWEELELLITLGLVERSYDKNNAEISYSFNPIGEMYMREYVQ